MLFQLLYNDCCHLLRKNFALNSRRFCLWCPRSAFPTKYIPKYEGSIYATRSMNIQHVPQRKCQMLMCLVTLHNCSCSYQLMYYTRAYLQARASRLLCTIAVASVLNGGLGPACAVAVIHKCISIKLLSCGQGPEGETSKTCIWFETVQSFATGRNDYIYVKSSTNRISFAPVFQWCCSTPQGSPGVGRNTFLSSSHLCFIIVFICDLFVSLDDPLMS